MKTLKILAAPLALAVGLALALPAQAQPQRHDSHQQQARSHQQDAWRMTPARNSEIRQDIHSLDKAIDRAASRRAISQREAKGLRQDARGIQRLYANYARGGLTRTEVRTLQARVNTVRSALRMERRDWDSRRG